MAKIIRKPAVAGMFYPKDPTELRNVISSLLEENKPTKNYNDILGIIAPHAGYLYSGKSAAIAYNVLKQKPDFTTVIILSPSHHTYFDGCSIYKGDYYQTPLGDVPVSKVLAEFIDINSEKIFLSNKGHAKEHAIEVQLPFLQMIKSDFDIVPIIIGNQSAEYIRELSDVLSGIINEQIIIVASSDLSHFHNSEIAKKMDSIVIDDINNFEYPDLFTSLSNGECEACGGGAIVSLMETADVLSFDKAEVLSYTNSGNITNDKSSVVGYLSAVIYNN
jgi:AmmeMemoRadiSam system protein B